MPRSRLDSVWRPRGVGVSAPVEVAAEGRWGRSAGRGGGHGNAAAALDGPVWIGRRVDAASGVATASGEAAARLRAERRRRQAAVVGQRDVAAERARLVT